MTSPNAASLIERLDRLLPQTQCGQCGFEGCRPYAQAMARGEADIDHCPPGGDAGARALAKLLGVDAKPYDRSRGEHRPGELALIIEADCIGCTKCIQACPWMRLWAAPNSCTPYWMTCARDARCASRPAQWIASRCNPVESTGYPTTL